MSDTDASSNDNNGFTQDDEGVWPDPSSPPKGSGTPGSEFDNLTWKQIMAAIRGGGALSSSAGDARATNLVDSQTLADTATTFNWVQNWVAQASQSVKEQAEALVGDKGPWQGQAADAFTTMVSGLTQQMDALVHQINDSGETTLGARDVPNQLMFSKSWLEWAQISVSYIDTWYATQAGNYSAPSGSSIVQVSNFPEAVQGMTEQMRNVAHQLAQNYSEFNIGSYTPGTPPANTPTPVTTTPPGGDPPPGTQNPPPDGKLTPPPDGQDLGADDNGGTPPPLSPPPAVPTPTSGSGPGGLNPPASEAFALPPGGIGTSPSPIPPPAGLDGFGSPLPPAPSTPGPGGQGTLPPLTTPSLPQPPGSDDANDDITEPGGFTAPALPNVPAAEDPADGGSLPPAPLPIVPGVGSVSGPGKVGAVEPPPIPAAPGAAPGDLGAHNPLTAIKPADLPAVPGATPVGNVPPLAQGSDTQAGGLPFAPPGGSGGAGGVTPGAERPDSSGLLGGVEDPWVSPPLAGLGDPAAVGEALPLGSASWAPPAAVGVPGELGSTTVPAAVKPADLPAVPAEVPLGGAPQAGGLPFAPPGGSGGAGGVTPGAERPDSSGLLGGVEDPWASPPSTGLGDPIGEALPSGAESWAGAAPSAGYPPVPPGSAGGPQTSGTTERPDAAGLLQVGDEPWQAGSSQAGAGDPEGLPYTPAAPVAPWAPVTGEADHPLPNEADAIDVASGAVVAASPSSDAGEAPAVGWGTGALGLAQVAAGSMSLWDVGQQNPAEARLSASPTEPTAESARTSTGEHEVDHLRVPVVPPAGTDEAVGWDVGTAEFLSAFFATGARQQEEELVVDIVERSDEAWRTRQVGDELSRRARYRRVQAGKGPLVDEVVYRSGGGDDVGPVGAEDLEPVEADEEEQERTMADLLTQDQSVWGRSAAKSMGLLE